MTKLLNSRQEAFCRHFCATGNAAAAARKAGYSVHSARQTGHDLLDKPWIIDRVRTIRAGWRQTAQAEAAVLLARLEQAWDAAVAANDGRGSPCHMLQVIRLQAEISGVIAKGAGNRADLWDVPDASAGTLEGAGDDSGIDAAEPTTPLQTAIRHGRDRAERTLALRRTLARHAGTSAGTGRHTDPVQEVRGQLVLVGEIETRRRLARAGRARADSLTNPDMSGPGGAPGFGFDFGFDFGFWPDPAGSPIVGPIVSPIVSPADDAEIDAGETGHALQRRSLAQARAAGRPAAAPLRQIT